MSLQSNVWRRTLTVAFQLSNICLYAVCGRTLDRVNQKQYWEDRSVQGVDHYPAIENDTYYQHFDKTILAYLVQFRGLSKRPYLEIGAYQGYRLEKFARQIPERMFVGADLGLVNLQIGKQLLLRSSNAFVINADACQLPFPSGSSDLVYSVTCLSSIPHSKIRLAMQEIFRVSLAYVLLVEIDCRSMRLRKKLEVIRTPYLFMHQYEKLVDPKVARLIHTEAIRDAQGHPRYTMFLFAKCQGVESVFWEKRKVLVFAREAGGADTVAPVVQALQQRHADCLLLAKGPSCDRFASRGLSFQPLPEYSEATLDALCMEKWHSRPEMVFTSATSLPSLDMTEKYLWRWAASRGVPSAAILDQWQNYALRFSGPTADEKLQYLPDRILVMDQVALRDVVAEGLPAERLLIAGQPALDEVSRMSDLSMRWRVRREMRLPEDKPLVVFIAESLQADFGSSLGYDEHTTLKFLVNVLSTCLKAGQANSLHMLVKLHPQNRMDQFAAELADASFPTTVIAQQYQPVEVLQAADLVVGMSSILLVHAIMMDKPTVSLQLASKKPSQLIATRVGAIPFLKEGQEAREVLIGLLQDKRKREAYIERQRQWDLRKGDSVSRVLGHLEFAIREAHK